jgi:hypothetical protein
MDAAYFLKERTRLLRFYYKESEKAFRSLQSNIELGQPPFDNPPYSEDTEPAFLQEWTDAETAVDILGQSCVAILSDTLKLYFQTLQSRVVGFSFGDEEAKLLKRSFVAAYKDALGQILDTDWNDCPVRFDIVEQVVLARNRTQHGASLISLAVSHDANTLSKHPQPFFTTEDELKTWLDNGGDPNSFFCPTVKITRNNLFAAFEAAETLADWIESRMTQAQEWRERMVQKS